MMKKMMMMKMVVVVVMMITLRQSWRVCTRVCPTSKRNLRLLKGSQSKGDLRN